MSNTNKYSVVKKEKQTVAHIEHGLDQYGWKKTADFKLPCNAKHCPCDYDNCKLKGAVKRKCRFMDS